MTLKQTTGQRLIAVMARDQVVDPHSWHKYMRILCTFLGVTMVSNARTLIALQPLVAHLSLVNTFIIHRYIQQVRYLLFVCLEYSLVYEVGS